MEIWAKPIAGSIIHLKGDARTPALDQHTAILQVCNDIGVYGAGFSGAIEKVYPGVKAIYKGIIGRQTPQNLLGKNIHIPHEIHGNYVEIVCMIARRSIRTRHNSPPAIRYDALDDCLTKVAKHYCMDLSSGWRIQMPRIGCGLAGGSWDLVEPIIKSTICAAGCDAYVYDY